MYRGFKIDVGLTKEEFPKSYALGLKNYNSNLHSIRAPLSDFIKQDNSLDGSAIQSEWFPQINADVFLSHPHNDLETALIVSGWLEKHFGLKSFIDSAVWGYCDELLRELDNDYCLMPNNLYNYQLRNRSTTHVHMMLSTALTMMIDKTECMFFLNAPGTLTSFNGTEQTFSPWIYSEIAATQVLRQRLPKRKLILEEHDFSGDSIGYLEKAMKITYNLDFTHLNNITGTDLGHWKDKWDKKEHSLDLLYRMYRPKKVSL